MHTHITSPSDSSSSYPPHLTPSLPTYLYTYQAVDKKIETLRALCYSQIGL